jgi:uncharacterized protein (DUF58 family)
MEVGPVGAAETFAGGTVAFTLSLAGRGADRSALVVRAHGRATPPLDVAADGHAHATLDVPAMQRGLLPFGRVSVTTSYPLGLWRGWAWVHFPLSGVVFPMPESGAPPLPASPHGIDGDGRGGSEDADLSGVRDYRPGDPLQRVAWKAVARGGGWFTKEFEGTRGAGMLVLDWRSTPASMPAEARLSRLCAWVLACERAMRPYALRLPDVALPTGLGREHRHAALTALALCEHGA